MSGTVYSDVGGTKAEVKGRALGKLEKLESFSWKSQELALIK